MAAAPATLTASLTPAAPLSPGGVCQVPGIGDIGGLVGLCNQGSSGIVGDLNNICQPSLPQPEQATGGINAMVQPPGAGAGGKTLYDNYGVAGQFWAAHGLQCSDMTSLIGNNVAGMVFDAAKSIDRVTITVYQSAAGNDILTWLQDAVDRLISALGNAIYFPYLAPVVILGAIWLAWQGLIRKRATRTIEGTLWMVVACVAAIALIGRPAAFTGVGTTVSNGVTGVLNIAFSKLPVPASSNCVPVQNGDPQSVAGNFAFTSGNGLVDENANELWSVLVCKPWLYGELGSTAYATDAGGQQTVVNKYGRQLLWSQAIAANETPSTALVQAKQATYSGIASSMQQQDPAVYPLFQGNQWTTRLEIAFAAMFAALVAGLLILLIALTLIVLKLGLPAAAGGGAVLPDRGHASRVRPGHRDPLVRDARRRADEIGGGRDRAVGAALRYSLIMGTADAVLPWALKILMIALVTVAVFIYRKPFSHLFSAVGYGTLGSTERAEYSLREASHTFRRSTLDAATAAVPGMASYRAARWARRNPGQAAGVAAGAASARRPGPPPVPSRAGPRPLRRPDPRPTRRRPGPATPTRRGSARTRRLRPTGTARPAAAPAGWSAGLRAGFGPGQERDRGGRRQRPGGPAARPAAAARRGRGRGAERIRRTRVRAGLGLVPRRRAPGGHRVAGTAPRDRVVGHGPPPRAASAPPASPVRSQSRGGGAAPPVSRPAPRPSSPAHADPAQAGPAQAVQLRRVQRRRPGLAGQRLAAARAPASDPPAGPGRTRRPSRPRSPRTPAAARGPAVRTNRRPRRSGCARSAGTSRGRPPWTSVPASRRPSSPWSSWFWPRSATGSSCPG